MNLNNSSDVPLHIQLQEILKSEILEGKLIERIPSERELMDRFSVSRTTVRQAISGLIREGILKSKRGSGTFIHYRPVEEWLGNITTYNRVIEESGMKPGTQLLSHGIKRASKELNNIFGLDEIYFIERLRLANDTPIAIEEQYYSIETGHKLAQFNLNEIILYDSMESIGINLYEAEQVISSATPTPKEAEYLNIPQSTTVLVIERLTFDYNGNIVEYLRSVFRSDMYAFRIKLMKGLS